MAIVSSRFAGLSPCFGGTRFGSSYKCCSLSEFLDLNFVGGLLVAHVVFHF